MDEDSGGGLSHGVLQRGGGEDGRVIYNGLAFMFIQVHKFLNVSTPKSTCLTRPS